MGANPGAAVLTALDRMDALSALTPIKVRSAVEVTHAHCVQVHAHAISAHHSRAAACFKPLNAATRVALAFTFAPPLVVLSQLFIVLSAVLLACLLSGPFVVEGVLWLCDAVGFRSARDSSIAAFFMGEHDTQLTTHTATMAAD